MRAGRAHCHKREDDILMSVPPKERLRTMAFTCLRRAFRLLPMSEGMRDRLRQRFLGRFPDLVPAAPRGRMGGKNAFRKWFFFGFVSIP